MAAHYEETGDLAEAEKLYRDADCAVDAWNMYVTAHKWEAALRVATECLSDKEKSRMYLAKGADMERTGERAARSTASLLVDT